MHGRLVELALVRDLFGCPDCFAKDFCDCIAASPVVPSQVNSLIALFVDGNGD
jgi:hypothetical protein